MDSAEFEDCAEEFTLADNGEDDCRKTRLFVAEFERARGEKPVKFGVEIDKDIPLLPLLQSFESATVPICVGDNRVRRPAKYCANKPTRVPLIEQSAQQRRILGAVVVVIVDRHITQPC